ncbi:Protein of unknown function [Gryllus bimaculatus]|nr:Protein of unknown function [Gryllus bimaculatus]
MPIPGDSDVVNKITKLSCTFSTNTYELGHSRIKKNFSQHFAIKVTEKKECKHLIESKVKTNSLLNMVHETSG